MPSIGEIVFRKRTEAGLSREQAAELSGLSKGYLADLEQDRYADLTTGTIRKLRLALPRLTCDELLAAGPASPQPARPRGRPKTSAEADPSEKKGRSRKK